MNDVCSPSFLIVILHFGGQQVQGFELKALQAFYHFSHTLSPFALAIFQIQNLANFYLGQP
jgi:hypothetical protein